MGIATHCSPAGVAPMNWFVSPLQLLTENGMTVNDGSFSSTPLQLLSTSSPKHSTALGLIPGSKSLQSPPTVALGEKPSLSMSTAPAMLSLGVPSQSLS